MRGRAGRWVSSRGGKWSCPRWRSGCCGRSGLLGVAVSVWLCLLTLVHLSLHPAPLVPQLPRYHDNQQATLRAESPVAFLSQGERAILSAADDPGYPEDVAFAGDDGWDAGWTPRTGTVLRQSQAASRIVHQTAGTGLRHTHEAARMVPQTARSETLGDEVSWPTDLSPGKDVRDKRMLLTKEDSAQDAENVDFFHGRDAREAGPPTPEDSVIASSRKGTSAKSEARPSASSTSTTALPGLITRSQETHREETQLERVPVWPFSQTVSPPRRLPPRPLVLPQVFPATDLRYFVNPEHLADVSNGKVNPAVDSEARITGVHGEYQHQFSDGGGQRKETQTQISRKHLMYSSASPQHQSHLTRNNHDTIQTDTHSANRETILTNQDSANRETILTNQDSANRETILTNQDSANRETILTNQDSANREPILTNQDSANREPILTNQDSANHETILTDQNGENQNKIHTFQHSANHEAILTDQYSVNKNTTQTVQHSANHETILTDQHSVNKKTTQTVQHSANHETILKDQHSVSKKTTQTVQHSANHKTILTDQHSVNKKTTQTVQHGVKVNTLQSDQHPVVGDSGGLSVTALPLDTEVKVKGRRLEDDGFVLYAYNVTASDALPMDRPVPDTRPQGCPRRMPDVSDVGPVSVVICTHNEAPSVLRRTVYSVLRHTPSHLLRDVIVVDDNSTLGDPQRILEVIGQEVTQGKLRLLRTEGRQGLVRARLLGARAARGKVLVFLDSHCECGHDWLPPLLHSLANDRRKIVSPYIDVIRSESFAYARSPDNLQGSFNWRLEFGWRAIPLDDLAQRDGPHVPISTPVISGGLFAVDRQFFFDLGAYDDLMDIWGGENMELSFRVWMCGGSLEILPCSRVGHVFRSTVPYTFPGDRRQTVLTNLARAALVWMDDYSNLFFAAVNMTPSHDVGDMTSRQALRERLQCRSFEWYLHTVFPQLHVPSPLTLQSGQFKNRGSLLCLTASNNPGSEEVRLVACHGSANQTMELMKTGELKVGSQCVVPAANKQLTLSPCQREKLGWTFKGGRVYLDTTDLCMTSVDNELVRLQTCLHDNAFQQWEPSYTFTWPT